MSRGAGIHHFPGRFGLSRRRLGHGFEAKTGTNFGEKFRFLLGLLTRPCHAASSSHR